MGNYKYNNKNELEIIIKKSNSLADVLRYYNVKVAGGNYDTLRNAIKRFNIDISHFNGQGWSKNKYIGPKHNISVYLNNEKHMKSYNLKKRLIKEGFFSKSCNKCKLYTWNNLSIPLELEHIDGNNRNNNLSNLELLCPNCHAQTDTYSGKNIGNYKCESGEAG